MSCSVIGCQLDVYAVGYCRAHWARWRRNGDPGPAKIKTYVFGRKCSVKGCDNKHDAKGYCSVHRQRWERFGDPLRENTMASHGEPAAFIEKAIKYKGKDCLIWPYSRDHHGRAKIAVLQRDGRWVPAHVARLICRSVHGKPPTRKHEAAHNCGNGHLGCINQKHLEWKTHAQNCLDTIKHDRTTRGERQPNSKLTVDDVHKIRKLAESKKLLIKDIAAQFKVDPETISDIANGRTWSWLE